jgi:hypothetical protein
LLSRLETERNRLDAAIKILRGTGTTGDRLPEVSRVAMAAIEFATLRHFLEITEQVAICAIVAVRED